MPKRTSFIVQDLSNYCINIYRLIVSNYLKKSGFGQLNYDRIPMLYIVPFDLRANPSIIVAQELSILIEFHFNAV